MINGDHVECRVGPDLAGAPHQAHRSRHCLRSQGRFAAVAGMNLETPVLQFWDYAAGNVLAVKALPHGSCRCVTYSRNGTLLACSSGSRVLLWNPETFALVATLTGHSQDVTSLAFSAEVVSWSPEARIRQ